MCGTAAAAANVHLISDRADAADRNRYGLMGRVVLIIFFQYRLTLTCLMLLLVARFPAIPGCLAHRLQRINTGNVARPKYFVWQERKLRSNILFVSHLASAIYYQTHSQALRRYGNRTKC